jgi:transposase
MLTAEKSRRAGAPKVIGRSLDEHIRWLEKRLAGFDDELSSLNRQTPIWHERDRVLRSVPGSVLAHLPELGTLNRKQIAALVGFAPINCDSGSRRRSRSVWDRSRPGPPRCTWPRSRRFAPNPIIRDFYPRLRKRGKPSKSAVNPCLCKPYQKRDAKLVEVNDTQEK